MSDAAALHEQSRIDQDPVSRKRDGVYYTPQLLVDHLLEVALLPAIRSHCSAGGRVDDFKVLDPSMGAGRILISARDLIAQEFAVSQEIATNCIYGFDIDGAAVDLVRESLPTGGRFAVADALAGDWSEHFPEVFERENPGFDAILGNPPFLNRISKLTRLDSARKRSLKRRFAEIWAPYANEASLFLVQSLRNTRTGGVVALVQPESLLGARDSLPTRHWVESHAALAHLWVAKKPVFAAAVRTILPVFIKCGDQDVVTCSHSLPVVSSAEQTFLEGRTSWGPLASDVYGLPLVPSFESTGVLNEVLEVSAGHLKEFYAIAPFVREFASGDCKLVTTGMISRFANSWGKQSALYRRQSYFEPAVDLAQIPVSLHTRKSIASARSPKLLLATQTRRLEITVDDAGECLAAVPLLTLIPQLGMELLEVATLFASPLLSVLAARETLGTGLAGGVIKLNAEQVRALPLPKHVELWKEASSRFEIWWQSEHDLIQLIPICRLLNLAYGLPEDFAIEWWLDDASAHATLP